MDMLIRGGKNVYPAEIENFLTAHPDIAEASVFGVPDAKLGEEGCAWIILSTGRTPTEDALRKYCDRRIAHYKIPRYVRFVDSMPLTATGKPQKYRMQEQMIAELGLAAVSRTVS